MSSLFIKKIKIKNYKCFEDILIETIGIPDAGLGGSGLNILLGENNSGKTALFSIFTKLYILIS